MATMAITFVATDTLNADLYGSTSAAYRTRDWVNKIQRGRSYVGAWFAFSKLNSILDDLFNGLYRLMEDAQKGVFPEVPEGSPGTDYEQLIDHMWGLHNTLDSLCRRSTSVGLRKKPLFKKSVQALENHREQLLDMIQWVEESTDSERLRHMEEVCNAAVDELHRGETVIVG